MRLLTLVSAAAVAVAPSLALAQGGPHPIGQSGQAAPAAEAGPASKGLHDAMAKMHRAMADMKMTGRAEVDFRMMMIPHHQSAIDMAKVALEHSRDPETRRLAEEIVRSQEREIAEMTAWLARQGHPPQAGARP